MHSNLKEQVQGLQQISILLRQLGARTSRLPNDEWAYCPFKKNINFKVDPSYKRHQDMFWIDTFKQI